MGSLSFEIKARCPDPGRIRKVLLAHGASFKGLGHQVDTYFRVPSGRPASKTGRGSPDFSGRLKLREGNIENALIYYKRDDQKKSKRCDSTIVKFENGKKLKIALTAALGVLIVVGKRREIFFIRNTKFHIDRVKGLGNFVEIEVFGRKGSAGTAKLKKQCEFYQKLLGISSRDLLADSYSDQLLRLETADRRLKTKTKNQKGFCCGPALRIRRGSPKGRL